MFFSLVWVSRGARGACPTNQKAGARGKDEMGICTDKSTTYLRRLGYNVVRHPREGVRPLDLIGRQRDSVTYLGSIEKLITTPPGPLPRMKTDHAAAGISGQSSSKLSLAVGLNVLCAVLSAFGAGAGATAKYKDAKTIQFIFGDVLTDHVAPLDIGNFLKNGEVDDENPILNQYVMGNGRLYVLTRTIKTNKFTVKAEGSGGAEVRLDVPAIQQILDGHVRVSTESDSGGTVTYEGTKNLTFGFECFEVGVEEGTLTMMSAKAGSIALSGATGAASAEPIILDPVGLLDLEL